MIVKWWGWGWGWGYKKVDKDLNSIFSKCLIVPICICR